MRDYFGQATSEYNYLITEGLVEALDNLEADIGIMISDYGQGSLFTNVALLSQNKTAISIRKELLKPSSPATFASWSHLQLKYQDAKEFQAKLASLLEEYEAKNTPKQKSYYMQLAIVPEV